jgi:hypothetical protein
MTDDTPAPSPATAPDPFAAPPALPAHLINAEQVAAMQPESRASLAKMYRERGYSGESIDAVFGQPTPDGRTVQEKQFDAAFPAGDADEIRRGFDLRPIQGEGHDVAEVGTFTADLAGALAESGLPSAAASSLGSEMIANAHRSQGMDAEAVSRDWEDRQRPLVEELGRRAGMPTWEDVSKNVKLALDRVNPQMRESIVNSGALNSASIVINLALHGQRLAHRAAMRPKAQ